MRRIYTYIALIAIFLLTSANTFAQVSQNGKLTVSGNRIVNKHGASVSFAGPSLFWSNSSGDCNGYQFYNATDVAKFKNDWNATIIRAAMGIEDWGGYFQDPETNKARVIAVVEAAIANDMYVIIDWHDHYAHNHTEDARAFFLEMVASYGNVDNVIFEIYNEPKEVSWSNVVKPYAETIIGSIRDAGANNLIIVGTPYWCQNVDEATNDPIDWDDNHAYSLHFYASDPGHQEGLRSKARTALGRNKALFVSEWGTCQASGDGYIDETKVNAWINFCKENELSHCMWSANDKGESASFFTPGTQANGNWSDANLTQSGTIGKNTISTWSPIPCTTSETNTRIEAESYCEMSGLQTEDCSEGGQNIGYWTAGDYVKYKINVPNSATYTLTLRVATTAAGELTFETPDGNTTIAIPQTSTDPDNWQVWQDVTAQVYLSAGTDIEIALSSTTGDVNLNWLDVSFDCGDDVLSTIEISPNGQTVILGESLQLSATGFSSCKEVAINPSWTGADNGLFSASQLGTFTVTATEGNISTSVAINVVDENATMLSDCESNEYTNLDTEWFSFADTDVDGLSSVTPLSSDANHFTMTAGGANGTANAAKISYTLNQGAWAYDPFVGLGFSLKEDDTALDLDGSTGLTFWHKGSAVTFLVPLTTITDANNYYAMVPAHTDWTEVTINWSQLNQNSWGTPVVWDASKITKFQWQYTGSTGDVGEVFIDEVKLEGLVIEDPCSDPTILKSITLSASSTQIKVNESVQLSAAGINTCDQAMPINPTWSDNAPNGLFSSAIEGTFNVTATVGTISDALSITVVGNLAPTANAGSDATIEQPANSITLSGSGTDPEGSTLTYSWTQLSGSSATIVNPNAASTQVNGLNEVGTYVFALVVNDGEANSQASEVSITVNEEVISHGIVAKNGQLNVNGNRIVNKNSTNVSFAGLSWYWSEPTWGNPTRFWNDGAVTHTAQDWNNAIVRIPVSTGEYDPESDQVDGWMNNPDYQRGLIKTMVDAAVANGTYIIIDWHAHYAHLYTNEAIAFFDEMASTYGHLDNVIFEIYNEPKKVNQTSNDDTPWSTIKAYAEQVIPAIRNHSDNLIICGTPFWSQRVNEASYSPLADNNTAYAFHFYDASWHDFSVMSAKVDEALNNGIALFVSEWGFWQDHDNHDNTANNWLPFMKERDLSWCVWELHDNDEPASILNPSASDRGPWADSDLDYWGKFIKPVIQGWNGIVECTKHNIESRVEAENYCEMSGIQLEDCAEGTQNVGYFDAGDWVSYSLISNAATEYDVTLRIATTASGKQLTFEGPNGNQTIDLPQTSTDPSNWQIWQDVTVKINLPAGEFDITLSSSTGGFNLNYMDFSGDDCTDLALASIEINPGDQSINVGESVTFTAKGFSSCQEVAITPSWSNNAPNGVFTATTEGTYTVTATVGEISQSVNVTVSDEEPFSVKIEAEDYVAMSGIQTETCSEGGLNVGYIDAGDWMDYANIDIPRAGTYLVEYRVASWADGAKIRLEQDAGTTFRGEIDVPNTYGWQNWITISHTVTLEAGVQHLAIYAPAGGFNVNWLQISSTSLKKATLNVTQDLQTQIKLYPNPANNHVIVDLSGNDELLPIRVIDFSGKQVMLIEASYSKTRIDITDLQPGIYLVNVGNTTQRLIKQ